jgi:protein-S-isoprenylcysteine O-methyltransferase Ste14
MRLLPPRLVLILILAMVALRFLAPGPMIMSFPHNLVGALVAVVGLGLALSGARLFSRVGTNIKTFNEPGTLVTGGAFRWTRNPMYLGFLLLLAGIAILLGAATPFVAVALFALVADRWYIAFEERALERKFGTAYVAYRQTTRRWI